MYGYERPDFLSQREIEKKNGYASIDDPKSKL